MPKRPRRRVGGRFRPTHTVRSKTINELLGDEPTYIQPLKLKHKEWQKLVALSDAMYEIESQR